MRRTASRGFSLIEVTVAVLVLGLLLAFSVPAFQGLSASYQLKGAAENIAAQLRLSREKAIATGVDQPMHFTPGFANADYHIHYPSGVGAKWSLPPGITYVSVVHPTMTRDGRSSLSGDIVLQDRRGNRDTVNVQISGLVLTK